MKKQKVDEIYDLKFSKQALSKLIELAKYYSDTEENLADVIVKGMRILDIAKKLNTSTLYVKDAPNSVKTINIKDL
jgi:hypothetical protein